MLGFHEYIIFPLSFSLKESKILKQIVSEIERKDARWLQEEEWMLTSRSWCLTVLKEILLLSPHILKPKIYFGNLNLHQILPSVACFQQKLPWMPANFRLYNVNNFFWAYPKQHKKTFIMTVMIRGPPKE